MEKSFINSQLAIFLKNDFKGELEAVSLEIKKQLGEDISVQILGIPADAPSEIPRLIANSSFVDINVSKSRIDFFFKKESFFSENTEKIWSIINKISTEVGRLGVVVTFFKETSIDILKNLFDQTKINGINPKEINIRFNELSTIEGIAVNNSQMYASGFASDPSGVKKEGVIITRDINTLLEELSSNSFDEESTRKFVETCALKAKETLI